LTSNWLNLRDVPILNYKIKLIEVWWTPLLMFVIFVFRRFLCCTIFRLYRLSHINWLLVLNSRNLKLLFYMSKHQMCHLIESFFVSFVNLILNVASLACRKKKKNHLWASLMKKITDFFLGNEKSWQNVTFRCSFKKQLTM